MTTDALTYISSAKKRPEKGSEKTVGQFFHVKSVNPQRGSSVLTEDRQLLTAKITTESCLPDRFLLHCGCKQKAASTEADQGESLYRSWAEPKTVYQKTLLTEEITMDLKREDKYGNTVYVKKYTCGSCKHYVFEDEDDTNKCTHFDRYFRKEDSCRSNWEEF